MPTKDEQRVIKRRCDHHGIDDRSAKAMVLRRQLSVLHLVLAVSITAALFSLTTTFRLNRGATIQTLSTEEVEASLLQPTSATTNVTATWRPDRAWIDRCVKELESSTLKPFRVVWRRYVLGDCIKQCRNCYMLKCVRHPEQTQQKGSGCYEKTSRNDTFAAKYHFRACRSNRHVLDGNLTIVDQILKEAEEEDPSFVRPPSDALVMHLRLGDVIENSNNTVTEMLAQGGDPWHTNTYKSAIKSINEYLSDIESSGLSKIVIRGGSHDPHYYKKSRIYAGCLFRAIRAAGHNSAEMELEGMDPDHDFYFMGYAKNFIVSSGGFSRLMGTMVKRHGGRIVGREFLKYHAANITTVPPKT